MRNFRMHYLFFIVCGLSAVEGCSHEAANATVDVDSQNKSSAQVANCIETVIANGGESYSHFSQQFSRPPSSSVIIETGEFNRENVMGIRIQASSLKSSVVRIKIKAYGPGYGDLGAERAAETLSNDVSKCLHN